MNFAQIDELLRKLKNLEREESSYEWKIKHTQQCLKDTVDAKVRVLHLLGKHGIRNGFDLKVYLDLRKVQTYNGSPTLDVVAVSSEFH